MARKLRCIGTLFFFLMQILILPAQVQSKSYQFLLNTLLTHNVPECSVAAMLKAGWHDAVLLDARDRREYEVSHLPNAHWVGFDEFDAQKVSHLDKGCPIIVYCSVGYRSEKIAKQLQQQGFINVENLVGGIFEWKNQGGKVYNTNGETQQVHAYNRTWGIWLTKGVKVYD
ncbi:MAG: rhodanese-like domain-containing protein [Saprospiraceae bacterium]|nr:rhodanese-like domain-containing protein [Saprospiraceae bacterium]MBP7679865.1 rhodanese-like domain-containing protein [Saprospiraceae bacterium]